MNLPRIAIIGGGPGGLLTAFLLQRRSARPFEVTIFEASGRLGGKIVSRQFDAAPVPYEAGAAELYDYSEVGPDPLRELVREFGLPTRRLDGKTVVLDDQFIKDAADVRAVLGERTAAALADFGRRARELVSPQDYYESDWKADNKDPLARQRFSELLATVPDAAARRYVRVSVHSDLATEPHQTNAMYGLQNYLMNEPGYMRLYSIDGGIERLTRELAGRVRARVLLEHRVGRVARTADGTYRVSARGRGRALEEEFDYVVAALPNNWLPAVEWGGPGPEGERLAAAMHAHHVHYDYPAHYLRVSLLFRTPFWRERVSGSYFMLDAFGGCCVYDETSRCDGSLDLGEALNPGDVPGARGTPRGSGGGGGPCGVLGWLIAGEAALSLCNLDDAALITAVLDALPASLRHGREVFVEGRVHRWAGSVNGLPGGHPAREPDSRHVPEPEQHPELFVVGDYLFDSTLNGVFDSADTVAEWIAEELEEDAEA